MSAPVIPSSRQVKPAKWLEQYMLSSESDPHAAAEATAEWLADDKVHLSHGRAITRDDLKARGLKVVELEADPVLQDRVLTVHHITAHTFAMTPAIKMIENNLGRRFVQSGGQVIMPPFMQPQPMPGQP
ncbi:hypothetical protein [Nocardioides sp. PD653]|uniref:hypothetical protein n=1 Tax=Nocardioides sp. PD653 TaxID=393303 RepID=UPI0013FD185D|nr:hypothetical protein [Nocardioides sp. PD653]